MGLHRPAPAPDGLKPLDAWRAGPHRNNSVLLAQHHRTSAASSMSMARPARHSTGGTSTLAAAGRTLSGDEAQVGVNGPAAVAALRRTLSAGDTDLAFDAASLDGIGLGGQQPQPAVVAPRRANSGK